MTTIADVRGHVRVDLKDSTAGAYRWSDAELDRTIDRAVARYSWACPLPYRRSFDCIADQRAYDIVAGYADMARYMRLRRVEYPEGEYPPVYPRFYMLHQGNLFIAVDTLPVAGQTFAVDVDLYHVVDATQCTVPGHHLPTVELGAAGYAAREWAVQAANRVNADPSAVAHFRALAADCLDQFQRDLRALEGQRFQQGGSIATFSGYEI